MACLQIILLRFQLMYKRMTFGSEVNKVKQIPKEKKIRGKKSSLRDNKNRKEWGKESVNHIKKMETKKKGE